jgi:isopenicillin-N N-acyltransferase-like protein
VDEEQRSTLHRYARMERLLHEAAAAGPVTLEALRAFLRDHDEHPDSICRHASPALPEGERYQTVVSMIMDLHAGRVHAAAGAPCQSAYEEHQV